MKETRSEVGKISVRYIIRNIEQEIKEGKGKEKSYLIIKGELVSNEDALKILKEDLIDGIEFIEVTANK